MIRKIYMIEAYTRCGDLTARRYARNKRTAERIAKQYKDHDVMVRETGEDEHGWIDLSIVE